MGDAEDQSTSRTYQIGRGLLGLLLLGSLLACSSGACNIDMSTLGDPESKPRLGLTLQEGAITVVVPVDCVGPVERITLVDSSMAVVWDLRSLSPTQLPDLFLLGKAPQGFIDVQVAFPGLLNPEESYQLVVGAAPEGGGNVSRPTTTTTTTTTSPPTEGPVASDPTTTTSAPAAPTTESEFFDDASAVGSFEPKQVKADSILVGGKKIGLADFTKEACKDPDATTTTR